MGRPGAWLAAVGAVALAAGALLALGPLLGSRDAAAARPAPGEEPRAERGTGDVVAPRTDPGATRRDAPRPARAAGPAADTAAAEEGAPAAPAPPVAGRVLDVAGYPVGGVPVTREADGESVEVAVTAGDGRFALAGTEARGALRVETDAWTTVRVAHVGARARDREVLVAVAPAVAAEGRVLDEGGAPVAGARVSVELRKEDLTAFPHPLDGTESARVDDVRTDAAGGFALPRVPAVPAGAIEAEADGFEPGSVPLPAAPAFGLTIELARAATDGAARALCGVVLEPDGTPSAGALVRLDEASTRTDRSGRFRLALPASIAHEATLVAWQPGFLPARRPDAGAELNATEGPPAEVLLELGGAPQAIAGRLVHRDGAPAVGWHVQLADGTPVSTDQVPPHWAELPHGWASVDRPVDTQDLRLVTDEDGAFRVAGLYDRPYRFELWDPATLAMFTSDPIPAGTDDALVRVPGDLYRERLAGRVLSRRGSPVAGARVSLALVTARSRSGYLWQTGATTETDAEGRFELRDVPAARAHLSVSGDAVIPDAAFFEDGFPDGEVEIVVAQRCHFRVTGLDAGAARHLEMLDAAGDSLPVFSFSAHGSYASSRAALGDRESSPVFAVSEEAATAVLFEDGRELGRIPVDLVAGDVTELRFE